MILPFLLHHANRHAKAIPEKYLQQFYDVKDLILRRGTQIGYDVQHIKGKKCNSCGGTGQHARYSNTPPYKPYDWADCYHCWWGWYKLPKWICLARIKYGPYIFHKPLKREEKVKNPFTEEKMGWKVTENPVIEGYIEHTSSWVGPYAMLCLMFFYNMEVFKALVKYEKEGLRWKWRRLVGRIKILFTWRGITIHKPEPFVKHWFDAGGNAIYNDDLPF